MLYIYTHIYIFKVLTERRLAHQTKFPLHAIEFVHFLSDHIPVSQGDNEEYRVRITFCFLSFFFISMQELYDYVTFLNVYQKFIFFMFHRKLPYF